MSSPISKPETFGIARTLSVIQLVKYSAAAVDAVRREEPEVPQLGGTHAHASASPAVSIRTPIAASDSPPESLGQEPSEPVEAVEVQDDAMSDISDEVFWQDWVEEMLIYQDRSEERRVI